VAAYCCLPAVAGTTTTSNAPASGSTSNSNNQSGNNTKTFSNYAPRPAYFFVTILNRVSAVVGYAMAAMCSSLVVKQKPMKAITWLNYELITQK